MTTARARPEVRAPAGHLDRYEVAGARHAGHVALERRLFEVIGGWVPSVPEPRFKVAFRTLSFNAAWRAELWQALVPVGWGEPELAQARVGLGPVGELLDAAAALGATPDRLAVVEGVLLACAASRYGEERGSLTTAAGGPARRVLGLAASSVEADRREASACSRDVAVADGAGEALVASARSILGRQDS